jgi:hypothetical protein
MTEQQLRALVREALVRHIGSEQPGGTASPSVADCRTHASHGLFVLPTGLDADGPCLIEPAVTCNHCGYCKSYGH